MVPNEWCDIYHLSSYQLALLWITWIWFQLEKHWQDCMSFEPWYFLSLKSYVVELNESIICWNDEFSWTISWVGCLLRNRLSATRYMKVNKMGITKILRRIWLFFENKIKSYESFSKQQTQLIVKLNSSLRHSKKWSYKVFLR